MKSMDKYPESDVIYGEGDHVDIDDRFLARHPTEPWDPKRLEETVFLAQPSVFFRRELIDRFGLLDTQLHYCMDYEYLLRLARAGVSFRYIRGYFPARASIVTRRRLSIDSRCMPRSTTCSALDWAKSPQAGFSTTPLSPPA